MERNVSSTTVQTLLPLNTTAGTNATAEPFSVFYGCDHQAEGILFDLTFQSINVIVGIPANLLVIAILIQNRKEPTTSDIVLPGFHGCLF
ncbi:hypothetical protein OYC64_003577 [Pagothenia borchgrevinki]|uniref:Uncharacterized protein n=1 Tax=Pagothenia borchgrevinki TaxID=8213 RepID=A0ABD2FS78_PAGBO